MCQNLRRISWVKVNGKPELYSKTEIDNLLAVTTQGVNDSQAVYLTETLLGYSTNQSTLDAINAALITTATDLNIALTGEVDSSTLTPTLQG